MGRDALYLSQMFSSLAREGQALDVLVDDQDDAVLNNVLAPFVQHPSLAKQVTGSEFLSCVWDTHGPIIKIVQAIRQSGVRLNQLHVSLERCAVPWHSFLDSKCFAGSTSWLRDMTSLSIGVEEAARSTEETTRHAEVNALLSLLTKVASQLKQLSLVPTMSPDSIHSPGSVTNQYNQAVTRLFTSLSMPKLERLTMMTFRVQYAPLLRFLGLHGKRLSDFFLIGIDVIDCGPEQSRDKWHDQLMNALEAAGFPFDKGELEVEIDGEDEVEDEDA